MAPSLSRSRAWRFITFGALYLAQGLPFGLIAVGYLVLLSDAGRSNEEIGAALAWAYIPWSFKIIWGPLLDRMPATRFGRRRPFVVLSELVMGATLLALLFFDPKKDLDAILVVFVIHSTFAALQDVASDALAVDVLPEEERGRANSIMWACKSAGVAIGGGGGTLFAKHFGWPALFVTMALMIWAIMLLPLFLKEGNESEPGVAASDLPPPARLDWTEIKRSFSFREPLFGIAIAFLTPFGYALSNGILVRLMRVDLKMSEEAIASLSGAITPVAGVVGAFIGGFLADRIGARKTLAAMMLGVGVVFAVFAAFPGHWGEYRVLAAFTIAQGLFFYAYSAAALGFFMTLSNPAIGATQFAIFMASTNLCLAASARLGGWIADNLGYQTLFFVASAFQLVTIALLPLCDARIAERRFRPAEAVV